MAARESEFEEFCASTYPRLRGYLTLYCGDRDVAHDLTQEALARAYRDWRKLRRNDAAAAWVFRIATNLVHSHFRRKGIERLALARLRPPPATIEPPDPDAAVAVRVALRELPHRQRQALLLRYYADLPVRVIAEEMGCPEGTVKSLLSRGVDRMRTVLAGDTPEEARNV